MLARTQAHTHTHTCVHRTAEKHIREGIKAAQERGLTSSSAHLLPPLEMAGKAAAGAGKASKMPQDMAGAATAKAGKAGKAAAKGNAKAPSGHAQEQVRLPACCLAPLHLQAPRACRHACVTLLLPHLCLFPAHALVPPCCHHECVTFLAGTLHIRLLYPTQ